MELNQAIGTMEETIEDPSLPPKIRNKIQQTITELKSDDSETAIRVTTAIYEMEELIEDINTPMHAKTALWDIISDLESVKEDG